MEDLEIYQQLQPLFHNMINCAHITYLSKQFESEAREIFDSINKPFYKANSLYDFANQTIELFEIFQKSLESKLHTVASTSQYILNECYDAYSSFKDLLESELTRASNCETPFTST